MPVQINFQSSACRTDLHLSNSTKEALTRSWIKKQANATEAPSKCLIALRKWVIASRSARRPRNFRPPQQRQKMSSCAWCPKAVVIQPILRTWVGMTAWVTLRKKQSTKRLHSSLAGARTRTIWWGVSKGLGLAKTPPKERCFFSVLSVT